MIMLFFKEAIMSTIDQVISSDGNFLKPVVWQVYELLFEIKIKKKKTHKALNVSYLK